MRALLALLIGISVSLAPTSASAEDGGCSGTDVPPRVLIECSAGGATGDPGDAGGGLATYDYVWLPACPHSHPDIPGSADLSCATLNSCIDPARLFLTLWARMLTDNTGQPVSPGWEAITTECRDPGELNGRRPLTWQDVLTAIRRVGVPTAHIEVPAYTLVNLPTTVYTHPTTVDRTLTILGYTVDVHLQPTTYTWHFDDGHTTTTHTPGRPWPATDITHTWTHATAPHHPTNPSVDTTYTAAYRVDGGDWTTIPDTITTTGPTTTLPIRQATAVLVH